MLGKIGFTQAWHFGSASHMAWHGQFPSDTQPVSFVGPKKIETFRWISVEVHFVEVAK